MNQGYLLCDVPLPKSSPHSRRGLGPNIRQLTEWVCHALDNMPPLLKAIDLGSDAFGHKSPLWHRDRRELSESPVCVRPDFMAG